MTTISQRALGVREMPDREKPISELFRIAADEFVDADAAANLLEEMKTTTLEKMKTDVILNEGPMPDNKAERLVKSSKAWSDYIEHMVDARARATRCKMTLEYLRIRERELDRSSWLQRTEHKMGRQAT